MSKSDLRRYRRLRLDLPARIIINGIDEAKGQLVNISPGDLAMKTDATVVVGDAAVVRIQGLDVIEGTVARVLPDGFALSFLLSRKRRQLLTEQLVLRANLAVSEDLGDRRGTPRHKAGDQRTACRLADGSSLLVRIIDTSVDGISVDAQRKPPVGTSIHVGRARGIVMRHTPRGFVVIFDAIENSAQPKLRAVQ